MNSNITLLPERLESINSYRQQYDLGGRITPAYAGKRYCGVDFLLIVWDHPRIRGEKNAPDEIPAKDLGSPPHTRGKENNGYRNSGNLGITPAYAGKVIFKLL